MNRPLKDLLVGNYSVYIAAGLLNPVYALFVLRIGGGAFDAGATNGAFYMTAGLLMLVLSGRQDRIRDRRKILAAGFLIEALSSLMLLAVNNITEMYMVQLVHAIGVALWVPALKAVYADMEDSGHHAKEWSWFEGGDHFITGLAALTGGSLIALLSFKATFICMTIAQVVSAIAVWRIGSPSDSAKH